MNASTLVEPSAVRSRIASSTQTGPIGSSGCPATLKASRRSVSKACGVVSRATSRSSTKPQSPPATTRPASRTLNSILRHSARSAAFIVFPDRSTVGQIGPKRDQCNAGDRQQQADRLDAVDALPVERKRNGIDGEQLDDAGEADRQTEAEVADQPQHDEVAERVEEQHQNQLGEAGRDGPNLGRVGGQQENQCRSPELQRSESVHARPLRWGCRRKSLPRQAASRRRPMSAISAAGGARPAISRSPALPKAPCSIICK